MLVIATLVTLGVAVQQHYRVTLKLQDPLGHINDFDRWMIMARDFSTIASITSTINSRRRREPAGARSVPALSRPAAQFA